MHRVGHLVTELWRRHLRPEALTDFSENVAGGMTEEQQKNSLMK